MNKNIIFKISELIFLIGKKNSTLIILSIFLSICLAGLEIISLSMIIPLMDFILNQNSEDTFLYNFIDKIGFTKFYNLENILLFFVIIYFFRTIFFIFINFFNQTCFLKIAVFIKSNLLTKYLSMNYEKFLTKNYSDLLVNVNQTATIFSYNFLGSIVTMFSELLIFFVIMVLLLNHDFEKTIFLMIMFFIFGLVYYLITHNKIKNMGKMHVKFTQLTTRYISEIFKGLKFIKINSKTELYVDKINTIILNNLKIERNIQILSSLPRISLEFVTIFLFSFLLIFFKDQNNTDFISSMILYAVAALRIIPLLSKFLQSIQNFKYGRESLTVIRNAFFEDSIKSDTSKNNSQENLKNFTNEIILENIRFTYKNDTKSVLDNFNLEIKKGEKVAIVGKSGSGKSTLIDIIIGFLKPENGKLVVDGKDYTKLNYNFNKIIGYVPQQTFLFDDTIEKNISLEFEDNKINYFNLDKAIKNAELVDFINSKNLKLKFNIGDDGSMLSGGQKQRISIARALYKDPKIVILDEATSNLDNKTEQDIINTIVGLKDRTVIFITHNTNLAKLFDKVIDLDNQN